MNELKLYEEVKKAFTVEKGKILMVELTSSRISELVPELFNNLDDCAEKVCFYKNRNRICAIFDYLGQNQLIYEFRGRTFKKIQVVSTGEILEYSFYGDDEPINIEAVKRDLQKLNIIFSYSKGS